MTLLLFFCGFPCTVAQITASCITKCGQKCKELRGERGDEKKRGKQNRHKNRLKLDLDIIFVFMYIYIYTFLFYIYIFSLPFTAPRNSLQYNPLCCPQHLSSHIHINLKSFHFRNIKFWWRNTKKISGQAFLSVSVLSTKLRTD